MQLLRMKLQKFACIPAPVNVWLPEQQDACNLDLIKFKKLKKASNLGSMVPGRTKT